MSRYRRGGFLTVATGVAVVSGLIAGCGGGTASPSDGATGGAVGSGGSTGGAAAGNGGGSGSGGSAGQGGQIDAPDGAADLRPDLPVVNPTITLITPSSLPRNNGTFTLLVDGRDFPPGAEVSFETNVWTATVVSETRLSVQIPGAALGGMPREAPVQVSGPTPPYVESNIVYFTITAPQ